MMSSLLRVILLISLTLAWQLASQRTGAATDYDYKGEETCVTPFDTQYDRIETYLESIATLHDQTTSDAPVSQPHHLGVLRECLRTAGRFSYIADKSSGPVEGPRQRTAPDDRWQLPAETERRGAGDCEDKAIWLYAKLIEKGFHNIRLVVGKYRIDQPTYHAWVAYYRAGRVYILDPTKAGRLWRITHYPRGFYRPLYSYSKKNRWCHPGGHRHLGDAGARHKPAP